MSSFAGLADIPRALGSDDLTKFLGNDLLKAMPPREYLSEFFKNPFLIFTDGAWEDGKATGGAITYNPLTGSQKFLQWKFLRNLSPCGLRK